MASGQAPVPTAMPMQTVVLKVSIHCHGCKKKVRKVLKSVEGVHNVTVDAAQHKVTVTGTVDADTLVKRLYKSGKQALLLQPHGPPAPASKPEAAPTPPPATEGAAPAAAGDGGKKDAASAAPAEKKLEEPVKDAPAAEKVSEKKPEKEAAPGTGDSEKKPEAESKKEEAKPSVEAKKDGGESKQAAAEPKAKAEEPAKEAAAAKEVAGNDEGEAKKSSKPKKPEDAGGEAKPAVAMAERTLSAPPPKHMYEDYVEQHYYPPQPVLSYHMAQPRTTSVSYYAPQPQAAYSMQQQPEPQPHHHQPYSGGGGGYSSMPPPRRAYSMEEPSLQQEPMRQWSPSYLYMPYPHSALPESYYGDYYSSPPGSHAPPPLQDSHRMFDDENPNACTVM